MVHFGGLVSSRLLDIGGSKSPNGCAMRCFFRVSTNYHVSKNSVVHLVRRFRRSLVFVVGPAPLPSVEKVIANLGSARIAIPSQTSRDLSGQIRDPFTLTFCYIGLQKSRRQFKLLGETGIDFLSLSDISHALDAISIGALETLREMGGQNASRAR